MKGERQSTPSKSKDADDDDEGGRVDPNSPIVVTARRLDAARTRVEASLGATVYSLTNEAVENRPGGETGSVAAILTQTPGVNVVGNSLTIRGSRALQVRINDVIIPEAISDPAEHISSRLAETTHVITGTLPAQFGLAPAGVISVTTKSGVYQHGGQVELFAGTDGMIEPAVEWAGSVAGTSLFASGSFERDRTSIADPSGLPTSDLRHGFEGLVFADGVLNQNDRISLIIGGSRQRHSIRPSTLQAGAAANDDAYAVGSFQHTSGSLTVQASLFAAFATDEARFATLSRERRRTFGTQIEAAVDLGTAHRVRGGLLVSRSMVSELDPSGRITDGRTSSAVYVQDEWKITSTLTFNPGVRVEFLRDLGSMAAVEPRASVVWASPSGVTAHVGYARYAAAATLGKVRSGSLPDERDDYYDAGLQHRAGSFTFGVDAYLRSSRNFIAERQIIGEAAPVPFRFGRADMRGLEFSATYARGPVTAWANLALSQARGHTILGGAALFAPDTLRAASNDWFSLATERPVTGSGGLTWRVGKVNLSGDILASSGAVRTTAPGSPNGSRASPFAVLGFAAVYHARIIDRPTDVRLDFTNVTDARYLTRDASNLEGGWTMRPRGRALTVGIEQGF
jgi:outer membrane cobalamin receptor